jgi:predicted permease
MSTLWLDFRYALRSLSKNPMFVLVALLSLGLGIGANTAIFSLLDQALLRLLPVKNPGQLVLFSSPGPRTGRINTNYSDMVSFSYPTYRDARDRSQVFSGLTARFPVNFSLSWRDRTERITGELVAGNYFDVLGVQAAIGRTFTKDDDRVRGAQPIAMLSYAYWKSRFGGDPSVLNQTILLNNHPITIVGVAENGFRSFGTTEAPKVFVPVEMQVQMFPGSDDLDDRHDMWLNLIGRLQPGVSRAQAEAEMNGWWRSELELEVKDFPNLSPKARTRYLNQHLSLLPGGKGISAAPEQFSTAMAVLMGMVGVLLLIACANVANLLMARATSREKEIAIRIALGAGRMRIIRQLLVESLLLALGGGALAVMLAAWTGQALLSFLPSDPAAAGISADPDARVLLFTLGLSIVTGILFGLVPALQSTRQGVADTLKDQASSLAGGHVRARKSLVVSQVSLSLILLIESGLFVRSLGNVNNINPGFPTDHLLEFTMQPSFSGYNQARALALYGELQDRIAALPGVRAVSMGEVQVLAGDNSMSSIEVPGYQLKEGEMRSVGQNFVGPGYLAAMGIPLLSGRDLSKQDSASAPKVAVINDVMAKYYFGNENAVGRRFTRTGRRFKAEDVSIEIIGVVRDTKHVDLREKSERFIYYPYTQYPTDSPMTVYARTAQDPLSMASLIQQQVREIDPNLPVFDIKTMAHQIDESIFTDRLVAALSAAFGVLATVLAAVGLYGVMAYTVVRRTREIGIRMALGADRRQVLRMVMKEVALVAGLGIGIALGLALAFGRITASLLFRVSGHDPGVFAAATLVLALVALLAGYIPAIRATRIDPLVALRQG